ncbi:hypothetical protein LBMAG42_12570 [Deltaproteobacteria bacterium]|nr:hypothetical protein LBMAG42_12570 [Deltaproteobacteria bacterium]
MVSYLSKTMREGVKDGPWSKGAMATFADLFDQEIGERVAESGGFGLQRSLLEAMGHDAGNGPPPGERFAPLRTEKPAHSRGDVRVTSAFGLRADPFSGQLRQHHGLDLAAAEGTPVLAAADGVVRFSGKRGSYGNVVILTHADGTESRYAHCRDLGVKEGDVVQAGQPIASVGNTGRSTGAHLHFEVRQDGSPIDPSTWSGRAPLGEKDR